MRLQLLIMVHGYVFMLTWLIIRLRFLFFFYVERIVDGFGSNNHIKVIMVASMKGGRLTKGECWKKPVVFLCKWGFYFLGR
jgi:hypothetical protein